MKTPEKGTMEKELTYKKADVILFNIEYDTDGEKIDLPKTVNTTLEEMSYTEGPINEFVDMNGADFISDKTGFCVVEFLWEIQPIEMETQLTYKERYDIWFRNNYETGMEKNYDIVPDFNHPYYEPTPISVTSFIDSEGDVKKTYTYLLS